MGTIEGARIRTSLIHFYYFSKQIIVYITSLILIINCAHRPPTFEPIISYFIYITSNSSYIIQHRSARMRPRMEFRETCILIDPHLSNEIDKLHSQLEILDAKYASHKV